MSDPIPAIESPDSIVQIVLGDQISRIDRSVESLAKWLETRPAPEVKPEGNKNACELAFLVTLRKDARAFGHPGKGASAPPEVFAVHGAQFDLDGGNLGDMRSTFEAVASSGYAALAWMSHSATSTKPAGRLIVLYDSPCPPDAHERIYPLLVDQLCPWANTRAQKNCNRGWNRPRASAKVRVQPGALVNWRALLERAPEVESRRPSTELPAPLDGLNAPGAAIVDAWIAAFPKAHGKRDTCFAFGGWACRQGVPVELACDFMGAVLARIPEVQSVPVGLDAVAESYARMVAGGTAYGRPTLLDLLSKDGGPAALDALERAWGLKPDPVDLGALGVAQAKPKFDKEAARAQLVLKIGSAEEVAKLIVKNKLTRLDGIAAVFDEGRIWLPDDRGIWRTVEEHEIAKWTAEYDGVTYDYTDKGRPIWLKIGAGFTSSTLKQIQKEVAAPGFFAAVPAGVAFQNGWLALPSRTFEPGIEVKHRVRAVLPYDYDPDAPEPTEWRRYLDSIWRDDAGELDTEAVNLVHQMLGYLIAGRHEQEKAFLLLGPPRAGKGVLLKLIQEIFGELACSFKLVNLGGTFAMQSLLGISVAYDPDARRCSANETKANERLLSTSSHECQQVERKNQTALSVTLPTRLLIAANPPFGLSDLGGAVASRMMILPFPRSFLGREDKRLFERLKPEIPAIIAQALAALDDLDAVGGFIEPKSAEAHRTTLKRAENPMAGFLEDWCIVDTTSPVEQRPTIDAGVLYREMKAWCDQNNHKPPSDQKFSEILAQRGIVQKRPRANGRARIYIGVTLNE